MSGTGNESQRENYKEQRGPHVSRYHIECCADLHPAPILVGRSPTHQISQVWPRSNYTRPQDECPTGQVAVIFCKANILRECVKCRNSLSEGFNFPHYWWSDWCRNSNGYFGSDSGFQDNAVVSHTTWWKTEVKRVDETEVKVYSWQRLNILTHVLINTKITYVLLFDLNAEMEDAMYESINRSVTSDVVLDPYWIYAPTLEGLAELHEKAIWGLRGLVRTVEIERDRERRERPNSRRLHEIARHAIHQIETLDYAIEMAQSILASHRRFVSLDQGPKIDLPTTHRTGDKLLFFEKFLVGLRCRASANKDRLQNEIGLTFHMIAEMDTRVSRKIGQAAKEDSATMKTIAFITMLFLPATFISAVFSMSFFKFGDDGKWAVSDKFWVYWATALPITAVTLLIWVLTQWDAVARLWEQLLSMNMEDWKSILKRREMADSEFFEDKPGDPV